MKIKTHTHTYSPPNHDFHTHNATTVLIRTCIMSRENELERLHHPRHFSNAEHYQLSHKVYSNITDYILAHILQRKLGMVSNRVPSKTTETVYTCCSLIPSINHKEAGMDGECSVNVFLVATVTFDTGGRDV